MKNILASVILIMSSFMLQAQYVVLDETVIPYDSVRPTHGPNGKHFSNTFMGYHFAIPIEANKQTPLSPLVSSGIRISWMWKQRVSNFFSVGCMIGFSTNNYRYSQTETKTFPDTLIHKSQNIGITMVGTGLYFRFNFDVKRGNLIGHYLDAGGYADWNCGRSLATKDEVDFNQIFRTRISRLNYLEKYQYGLYAAIGLNKFTIYGRYRLSDVVKEPFKSAELPRLTVGIGLCIF